MYSHTPAVGYIAYYLVSRDRAATSCDAAKKIGFTVYEYGCLIFALAALSAFAEDLLLRLLFLTVEIYQFRE